MKELARSTNLERLQERLSKSGLEAYLLSDIESIQWATGFTGSSGYAIVTPNGGRFVSDSRYTLQASEQVRGLEVATADSKVPRLDFLAQNVAAVGARKVGFDADKMSVATYNALGSKLAGIVLEPAEDPILALRLIKQPDEIAKIRRACELADACLEHVHRLIRPGVSEWEIGLEIEFFFRKQMADLSFPPIVVSGARSAFPHGRASEKQLESGDFVTLDLGAKLDGYCSDITRTFVVGKASDRHKEIYNQVLAAQLAAIDATKPGAVGKQVDGVARAVLDEKGLSKYFGHGLGHGLGQAVHDGGSLGPSSEIILEAGQIWTIEPGVYIEGFGGVRIEDDVVVTESGCEILTHFTKDLLELPH